MANRTRRKSMEHLELYDLDKLSPPPPPLPPPRKHRRHIPPEFAFGRYQFLCDMIRHKTDPIYAATPMFTTIPYSKYTKQRRQIIGSHIPSYIVTPVIPTSPKSEEDEEEEEEEEEENNEDDDEDQNSDNDDDNNDDNDDDDDDDGDDDDDDSSSSSSSNNDDDGLDDDRGIVEQIFNRDK